MPNLIFAPFLEAARLGPEQLAQQFLTFYADNKSYTPKGNLLHYLMRKLTDQAFSTLVPTLAKYQVNLEKQDATGKTALMQAISSCSTLTITMLTQYGVKLTHPVYVSDQDLLCSSFSLAYFQYSMTEKHALNALEKTNDVNLYCQLLKDSVLPKKACYQLTCTALSDYFYTVVADKIDDKEALIRTIALKLKMLTKQCSFALSSREQLVRNLYSDVIKTAIIKTFTDLKPERVLDEEFHEEFIARAHQRELGFIGSKEKGRLFVAKQPGSSIIDSTKKGASQTASP